MGKKVEFLSRKVSVRIVQHATMMTIHFRHVSNYAEDLLNSPMTLPNSMEELTALKKFADQNEECIAHLVVNSAPNNWVEVDGTSRTLSWETIRHRGFWRIEQIIQALLEIKRHLLRQMGRTNIFRTGLRGEIYDWVIALEMTQAIIYTGYGGNIDTEGMTISLWQNFKHVGMRDVFGNPRSISR